MPLLSHLVETAPDATPRHTVFVLHGILGSLRNWRSMARSIVRRLPDWQVVLVDLRNHGDSHGFVPPHTLGACARDLAALAEHLEVERVAIIGHSFGGKVALACARDFPDRIRELWVLDSHPGRRPTGDAARRNEVVRVMEAVARIETPIGNRRAIVQELTGQGFTEALALWMTTNLRRGEGGYDWRFDLEGAAEMLQDYAEQDLTSVAESGPVPVHFVWGERSDQRALGPVGGSSEQTILSGAGHWLHADDPEGLLEVLVTGLIACRS